MEMALDINASLHCRQDGATAAAPPAMAVRDISLAFGGQQVLDGLSFHLPAASITLLRGENGSGKTTLLNVINGFIAPDSGVVEFNLRGRRAVFNGTATPERVARAGVGRLWQDIRLFPTMTALDNVMAATRRLAAGNLLDSLAAWPVWRREERAARERAMRNLEAVNMAHRAQSSCDMLSVGQMKRVAIARLLQGEAELLLLDEPLAGLDRDSAAGLIELLARLRDEHKKTMLVVEHRHERLMPACDRVLLLENGRLAEQEPIP